MALIEAIGLARGSCLASTFGGFAGGIALGSM